MPDVRYQRTEQNWPPVRELGHFRMEWGLRTARVTLVRRVTHEGTGARGFSRSIPDGPSVPRQGAGDDATLDLVGALDDLEHLGLTHVALDREVGGVAVAAEHLDGVDRRLHRRVRAVELCCR